MSMYDLVVGNGGQYQRGAALLAILGNPDPGRFRDAWVETGEGGEPVIAIYTRNGGGNRECYCTEGDEDYGTCTGCIGAQFAQHPLHLRNADDDFDRTYATYYFRTPDEYREQLAAIAQEPVNMSEQWQALIAGLRAAADAKAQQQ